MKILVLEDSPAFRRMLLHVLKADGHGVTGSEDGIIAYDRDTVANLDLLVVDIDLPRVNGIEAILSARHINPNLRIIAVSGGGTEDGDDYLNVCRDLGATEILEKPFEPGVLVELVRGLSANARVA